MAEISFDDLLREESNQQGQEQNTQGEKPKKPKKQKKPASKKKKAFRVVLVIIIIGLLGLSAYGNSMKQQEMQKVYEQAQTQFNAGKLEEAYELYSSISTYSDAAIKAAECITEMNNIIYNEAMELKEAGEYDAAILKFGEILEFGDVVDQIDDCFKIKRELYIDKMGVLIYKINKYKELAAGMCDVVNSDWAKAQAENKDVTVALQETFKTWEKDIRQLNIGNNGLKSQVESLGKLESTQEIYEQFMSYFEIYEEIHKQAVEPSGDIKNYKERVSQHSKEFDSLLEKMYVTEPSLKQIINREIKAAEQAEKEQEVSLVPTKEEQGEAQKETGTNTKNE